MKEDFIMKYKKSIFTLFILLFILYIYSSDNYSQSENQAIPYHDYIVDVITTKSAYNDKYSAHIPKEVFHALNQARYQNTVDTAAKVTVDIKQENYSIENLGISLSFIYHLAKSVDIRLHNELYHQLLQYK